MSAHFFAYIIKLFLCPNQIWAFLCTLSSVKKQCTLCKYCIEPTRNSRQATKNNENIRFFIFFSDPLILSK